MAHGRHCLVRPASLGTEASLEGWPVMTAFLSVSGTISSSCFCSPSLGLLAQLILAVISLSLRSLWWFYLVTWLSLLPLCGWSQIKFQPNFLQCHLRISDYLISPAESTLCPSNMSGLSFLPCFCSWSCLQIQGVTHHHLRFLPVPCLHCYQPGSEPH